MESDLKCHIALAHDEQWMIRGANDVLMSLLNEDFKLAVKQRMIKGEVL